MDEPYEIFLQMEVSRAPDQEKGQPRYIRPRIRGRRGFLECDKIHIRLKTRNDSEKQFPGGIIQLRADFISLQHTVHDFTIPKLQRKEEKYCFGPSGSYKYTETEILYSGYTLFSVPMCESNDDLKVNLRTEDRNVQVGTPIAMHSIHAQHIMTFHTRWLLFFQTIAFCALIVSILINI